MLTTALADPNSNCNLNELCGTAPVADAERHDLDGGDVIIDGDILIIRVHDRSRAGTEDHGRRIGIAVEKARIGGALAAADLRIPTGDLLVVIADGRHDWMADRKLGGFRIVADER